MTGKDESEDKKVVVLVTSVDGNLTHPFERDSSVGSVHQFAYDRLVKQSAQIPFDQTWLESSGQRLDDTAILKSLIADEHEGREPHLTFALSWATAGGWR